MISHSPGAVRADERQKSHWPKWLGRVPSRMKPESEDLPQNWRFFLSARAERNGEENGCSPPIIWRAFLFWKEVI